MGCHVQRRCTETGPESPHEHIIILHSMKAARSGSDSVLRTKVAESVPGVLRWTAHCISRHEPDCMDMSVSQHASCHDAMMCFGPLLVFMIRCTKSVYRGLWPGG